MTASLVALRDRREQVIAQLSAGYAGDLFDVDELDRRLDLAQQARTVAELDALVADLGAPSTALVPASVQAIDDPLRVPTKKLRVMLGSVERRGRWTVPTHQQITVFWGNVELDFREASFGPGVTTIELSVTMGNLEVIVPPELAVDVDISSFLGNVEERHRAPPDFDPARPVLRFVGAVRLGNFEIETRMTGESRREASKREKRERKQLKKAQQRQLAAGDDD